MSGTGFFEQKSFRPSGLALVVGLHAAAAGGLLLVKTTVHRLDPVATQVFNIPIDPPPPENPPEPPPEPAQQLSRLDVPTPIVRTQPQGPVVVERPLPPLPPAPGPIGPRVELARVELPPPPPVRVEAQVDPRYARQLQPPYPPREESAQREGTVRVRVTIGPDGRVRAIERLDSTSEAFWVATRSHALAHWRFRPATLDGRPIESTKQMNVFFRIEA